MAKRMDIGESALTDEDRYAIFNLAAVLGCGQQEMMCAHVNAGSLGNKMAELDRV